MKTILQNGRNTHFFIFIILLSFILFAPGQQAQTLIGHWQMDEGSGTTLVDATTNGYDGTIVGGPTWVTGVSGQALNLSGTQHATVTDNNDLDFTTGITLAAWIKPSVVGTQYIIKKAIQGTTDGYELSLSSTGVVFVRFNQSTSDNTYRVNSSSPYPTDGNTWMHIAATYDGTTTRIYINGVQENTGTGPAAILTNTLSLGIGAQSNGTTTLQGVIDDARVYDGALSPAAILDLATVLPTIPVLISPTNGALDVTIPPTLSWYASASATSYQVQVSTVSDFTTTIYDQSGITTTSTSVTGLSNSTLYYWRVNATNSVGTSAWSSTWSFTTLSGLPSIISTGAGFALDFDGVNDYVDCGNDASVNITGSITIEAWVKPTNFMGTNSIVKKFVIGQGYELFLAQGTGYAAFRLNDNAMFRVNADASNPTVAGSWTHIAATYDGTSKEMKIYINGVFPGSMVTGPTSIVSASSNLVIGSELPTVAKVFLGQIDEVRIWDDVRTIAEIQDNMCQKLSGTESNLVSYWRFDETSGTLMSDQTANGNDGTLTNNDGDEHDWSGAPLGDACASDYSGAVVGDFVASLGISSETFTATGSGAGTVTGIQVYRVDDNSLRVGSTVPSGWTVDPLRYWGVKVIGTSAAYDVVYDYTIHPGLGTEADLRLAKRDNLSDVAWIDAVATLDEVANTLTKTGETGTEYALASISAPLPVELTSFTAEVIGNTVKLYWKTETEVDNYGFDIERTTDNSSWKTIDFVEGHGNSNSPKEYNFIDSDIGQSSKYYYRLKQIDTDGKFEYSDVVEVLLVPDEFLLSQNFPNPFNPSTTISYQVQTKSYVQLFIYDVLGNKVAQLINEEKEPGTYKVEFDGSHITSGIYFYQLKTEDFIQIKKMILLK